MIDFPQPPFHAFGTDHRVVLALTVIAMVSLVWAGRRFYSEGKGMQSVREILAWVLLLSYPLKVLTYVLAGAPSLDNALPMHLCNWAAVIGFFALRCEKPLYCELLYFWGLAGTTQALLTPNIAYGFPHPVFFSFFIIHSGVVVAAIFVVWGLGHHPRRGAVRNAFLWAQVYLLAAGITNWALGSNYGFLAHKPQQATLLDKLGSWPYYIVSLELLALAFFLLLNLPFLKAQRREPVLIAERYRAKPGLATAAKRTTPGRTSRGR